MTQSRTCPNKYCWYKLIQGQPEGKDQGAVNKERKRPDWLAGWLYSPERYRDRAKNRGQRWPVVISAETKSNFARTSRRTRISWRTPVKPIEFNGWEKISAMVDTKSVDWLPEENPCNAFCSTGKRTFFLWFVRFVKNSQRTNRIEPSASTFIYISHDGSSGRKFME